MRKPLGTKAYGSIPHLPNSRMGPGDHHCSPGQEVIATQRKRDKYDRVIVQEKLDGSNVAIAKIDGKIYALTRAGYEARTSPYEQHHKFSEWVHLEQDDYFAEMLADGERLCGEWIEQAHGTRYKIECPFVAFDIIRGSERVLYDEFRARTKAHYIPVAHVLSDDAPMTVEAAMTALGTYGHHGAIDPVEGAVWRVERKGKVDFLCKYVRPDKKDGIYLPEYNNGVTVWNEYV